MNLLSHVLNDNNSTERLLRIKDRIYLYILIHPDGLAALNDLYRDEIIMEKGREKYGLSVLYAINYVLMFATISNIRVTFEDVLTEDIPFSNASISLHPIVPEHDAVIPVYNDDPKREPLGQDRTKCQALYSV